MSVRLMSKAFMANLPASQKLVLIVMCDYANDDGLSCHPSVAQVAVKASLSDRQCKRVLKQLADDGYLSVIGNANGGKPGTTRHYRIDLERLETGATGDTRTSDAHDTPTGDTCDTGDKLSRVTPGVETGDTGDTGGVTPRAKTGDTHVTQPTIDPSVNHHITLKGCPPNVSASVWSDYVHHRKVKRAALTKRATELLTKKLASLTTDQANACLELSIENGWTGVFPERVTGKPSHTQGKPKFSDQNYDEGANPDGTFG